MKFNHLTLNSNHCVIQDTKKVFESKQAYNKCVELFELIRQNSGNPVFILDGIYATGSFEEESYAITLTNEIGLPLLTSTGAYTFEANQMIRSVFINLEGIVSKEAENRVLFGPTVYDLITPLSVFAPELFQWSGDFCRCMAAIAFEEMKTKNKGE